MESLQIIILSKDRPAYLIECLNSVIGQKSRFFNIQILVSDNSETNEVEYIMKNKFDEVNYIRRIPNLSSYAHYRQVINESKADYLVIFHDDDLMMPNYAERMLEVISKEPNVTAVGSNNYFFYDKAKHPVALGHTFSSIQIFDSKPKFLMQNLCDPRGICPFPSYIYRKKFLSSSLFSEKDGGKYSDVPFLSKLIELGKIIWIPDVLMLTRIHHNNDSGKLSINDKLKLIRYMISNGIEKNNKMLRLYKFICWKIWFTENDGNIFGIYKNRKKSIIRKFIIIYMVERMLGLFYYKSIYFRVIKKLFPDKVVKSYII